MSALTYLTLTRLKNGIRDLLRKPARLIYVVFLLALLVFAVQGSGSTYPPESYRDLREVVAMATALFLFIFLLTVWNGFSKGGTIFSLSDVNLLFPSPIHRTRTLFYGLLCKSAQHSCWASFSSTNMDGFIISMASPWRPWSRSFYVTPQRSFWDKLPP